MSGRPALRLDGRRVVLVVFLPALVILLCLLPTVFVFWLLAPIHITAAVLIGAAAVGIPAVTGLAMRRRSDAQDV
ncbi:hypothetical protein GCM10012276_05270 [Nocardioides deserti]|nr:hypothetical protein GCM10012276_05270 [Nocardioides deserti]